MKKKILIVSIIIILILVILSIIVIKNKTLIGNNNDINIATSELYDGETNDKDVVLKLASNLSYVFDISDNKLRAENSDFIIIGTIKSIDGAINYNAKENLYTMTQTIGEMEINKVIKGDIKENIVPFIRLGGKIKFAEYEKSLVESQKNKLELVKTLTKEEKEKKYVIEEIEDDITIENNKTYLMYLKYDSDYDRYGIVFAEYGLREIDSSTVKNMSSKELTIEDKQSIKMKNNETGKYEAISNVIE